MRPPDLIASQRHWLVWKFEGDGPKPRKVPYYTDGTRRRGVQGTPSDRAKLVSFDEAVACSGYQGVGYASLAGGGITVVDFDEVFSDSLREDVERLCIGTYAEKSPSGRGVHAFFIGEVPGNRKDNAPGDGLFRVEFFANKGFTTWTGDALDICDMFGAEIAPLTEEVLALYKERFGGLEAVGAQKPSDIDPRDAARMLSHVSPDCDYDTWWRVGLGLHHEFGAEGFPIFDAWSKDGATYPGRDALIKKWRSISADYNGPAITIGTIKGLAAKGGWIDFDSGDFPATSGAELPGFMRDSKGAVEPSLHNTMLALEDAHYLPSIRVLLDDLSGSIMLDNGRGSIRPFEDDDYTTIRRGLHTRDFKASPSIEITRAAVHAVAKTRRIDSAQNWLNGLQWDGVPRIDKFCVSYMGASDNPMTRGVGTYLWTALAGRVLSPGVKADMVPVFVGAQGGGKSRAVRALVPEAHLFTEVDLMDKDADISRKIRGKLVAELGELRGLSGRDANHIKSFLSKTHESWVPKYIEYETIAPRRLVFIGTTNETEFLTDQTGNRRWLPVEVGIIKVDDLIIDRDQLWAEGAVRYKAAGVDWGVENLSSDAHENHMVQDSWDQIIGKWVNEDCPINGRPADRDLTIADVLSGALDILPKMIVRRDEMRAGRVLQKLGFERIRKRVGDKKTYVYHKIPF